ncbi:MAG: M20/M25/M40 family metallo-hydrolase [Gemmatimonadota bacterium]
MMGAASRTVLALTAMSAGAALLSVELTAQAAPTRDGEEVAAYVGSHRAQIVRELVTLLSVPNVASDSINIRKNAELIRVMMERRGIRTRLLETGGPPMVFGELDVAGASRTILFYCHYDGQPVDPSRWIGHAPFEPVLRAGRLEDAPQILEMPAEGGALDPEWRIYGRSASDDKAPIVAILTALDALAAADLRPTWNLKFLFEGDEEAGSPHLGSVMREHRGLLAADLAVFADGPAHPAGRPTVVLGVRGIVTVELTVFGPAMPLHSGHYGYWAPNPAERLAELLASMQDDDGRVTIEGWYDDVTPLEEAERAALERLPDDEDERRLLGISESEGGGRSRWEMVTLPSLNVRGLRSAWVGPEARTIVPERAVASLDFRLVRDVKPQDQVARFLHHLERRGYHVVNEEPDPATRFEYPRLAMVTATQGYPAVRTPIDDPDVGRVIEAVRRATGEEPIVIPTLGGSVPGYLFPERLSAVFVNLPTVNPDNNQHSPNENLRLGNLFDGVAIYAAVMRMPL